MKLEYELLPPKDARLELTFCGDKFTWDIPEQCLKGHGPFKLYPGQDPKKIDFGSGKDAFRCLYSVKGDTLSICVDWDTGDRPKEFKEDKKKQVGIIVFKRVTKK